MCVCERERERERIIMKSSGMAFLLFPFSSIYLSPPAPLLTRAGALALKTLASRTMTTTTTAANPRYRRCSECSSFYLFFSPSLFSHAGIRTMSLDRFRFCTKCDGFFFFFPFSLLGWWWFLYIATDHSPPPHNGFFEGLSMTKKRKKKLTKFPIAPERTFDPITVC